MSHKACRNYALLVRFSCGLECDLIWNMHGNLAILGVGVLVVDYRDGLDRQTWRMRSENDSLMYLRSHLLNIALYTILQARLEGLFFFAARLLEIHGATLIGPHTRLPLQRKSSS